MAARHAGRPTLYATVGRTGAYPGLTAEAARTRWARPYLPVPGVVAAGTDGPLEWLVTTGLPGLPATDLTLGEPASTVVALAEGLRRLHQRARPPLPLPVPAPGRPRPRAPTGSSRTRRPRPGPRRRPPPPRPRHRPAGARTTPPRRRDPVVCHGDYCPPNALLADGQVTGCVDLGELGVADRWWDLAVATRAVTRTYGPGLEGLFLDAYGARPDPRGQAFYRLLYDLAS